MRSQDGCRWLDRSRLFVSVLRSFTRRGTGSCFFSCMASPFENDESVLFLPESCVPDSKTFYHTRIYVYFTPGIYEYVLHICRTLEPAYHTYIYTYACADSQGLPPQTARTLVLFPFHFLHMYETYNIIFARVALSPSYNIYTCSTMTNIVLGVTQAWGH